MPQYLGFSTKDACLPKTTNLPLSSSPVPRKSITWGKKFQLNDEELVIQDFINALNIRKGSKVGQPAYGSAIFDFLFEPNTADVTFRLESEVRRIAALDTRIIMNTITTYSSENGILIEVEMAIAPFNNPMTVPIYVDKTSGTIYQG